MSNIKLILLFGLLLFCRCSIEDTDTRFHVISFEDSGLDFSNTIIATDSFNVIDFYYIYNGGGVGIGDFNNDGLQDVYFSGNQVSNKLYLNKGDFRFDDVTTQAQVEASDIWSQGIAVVDINHDGWLDMYVCASIYPTAAKRLNKLFINNGLNDKGIPTFREEAVKWGIEEHGHSSNAAFFDYDLDGDLDLFVLNNFMDRIFPSQFRPAIVDGSSVNSDKLYENTGDEHFTDISEKAGILIEGYSHGLSIRDLNLDGWPDIYITNDFLPNDILYINNQDGTFTNKVSEYIRHQCFSAMGSDIADINNDGLQDIFVLDMLPEINYRKKTMLLKSNPMNQLNYQKYDYDYQFIRNMFHLNMGPDDNGNMLYSDIGFLAGIEETDWSWSPLFADFDNDGLKDLVVANGFPGDVTDMDYANYANRYRRFISKKSELFDTIPQVKIDNYIFKNNGDLTFTKKTTDWGFEAKTFSNGAAFADFDNDGDLDYITNNINMPASLFINTTVENRATQNESNFLRIKLKGPEKNPHGFGVKILLYNDNGIQIYEHSVYRGFMSSMDPIIHFGLANDEEVDSLIVLWPGSGISKLYDINANSEIEINYEECSECPKCNIKQYLFNQKKTPLFKKENVSVVPPYVHREKELFDFNYQPTLPHKLSQYTPGIAVSDMNGDGLEDIYIGGNPLSPGIFLMQGENGKFSAEDRIIEADNLKAQDMGILFFDADNDGDNDLYLVSGGIESETGSTSYLDRLYKNDGNGFFTYEAEALPDLKNSGSCAKAADVDKDGDLDLFIGTRTVPGSYPLSEGSRILLNHDGIYRESTMEVCSALNNPEMVTDAIWTDFDNDSWLDLIVVGEWMEIKFYKNEQGKLIDVSKSALPVNSSGWWNCIAGVDIDDDGDTDYVCGNHGLNSIFQGNDEYPLMIFAKDFDLNGIIDPIVVKYTSDENYELKPFPLATRDGMMSQVGILKQRINTYREYGKSTIYDLFATEELEDSYQRKASQMQSVILINDGIGKFNLIPLPTEAQFAPVYGIITQDFDLDGNNDLLLAGNDYSLEYMSGRIDAFNGLLLLGDGTGSFQPKKPYESGFLVRGDAKGIVNLFDAVGRELVLTTQNKDSLVAHTCNAEIQVKILDPGKALWAEIELKNGKTRKHEFHYGSSYLSQSSRKLAVADYIREIVLHYPGEETKSITDF